MGRVRKPIPKENIRREGKMYVVRFKHPLTGRPTRCSLGREGEEDDNLKMLNGLLLNPDTPWERLPDNMPDCLRKALQTGGPAKRTIVRREEDGHIVEAYELTQKMLEREQSWRAKAERERDQYRKQYEFLLGRKSRTGPCPTLQKAREQFLERYTGRDPEHTNGVKCDLIRFENKFGPETLVDKIEGRELEIDAWLRGLVTRHKRPLTAGRRNQIRIYVTKMLESAGGIRIDRKALPGASTEEIRADRGAIRWLAKRQAERLAAKLPAPWNDYFRVQVGLGLRPDELITLKRADFSDDFGTVTLSPLQHLTLKRGSRTIQVPKSVQEIFKRRLSGKGKEIVFPNPLSGWVWARAEYFNREFRYALQAAGKAAKIPFKLDCRVGRRTCASLLLRSGLSAEQVAAVLGTSAKMIREHYAAIISTEVNPSAAALRSA